MINIPYSHHEGVYYYMIFNLAAILVGVAGAAIVAHKNKISFREFALIVSSGILMMLIGSKLILLDSLQWMSLLEDGHLPLNNGKSVVGAILGGMIGAWGAARYMNVKKSVLDLCAVSFPLSLAVQRMGCLFSGCCHGKVTNVPWGITYGPGSRPFIEHQHLGLIPHDAATSLAIHPDQIYNILACIVIALIAWKTSSTWKSPSGKFIFSVLLYLSFRFVEEFARYNNEPVEWLGLKLIQLKVLVILIPLAFFFYFREKKYSKSTINSTGELAQPVDAFKIALISSLVLFVTFQIGGWLTHDERTIILTTVLPLSGIAFGETILRTAFSKKFLRSSCLILFALILMSQKADPPKSTPKSYTSFQLSTATGKFESEHDYNYQAEWGEDCEGNPYLFETSDKVKYDNSYKIGGIGISRKIYYNQWRSLLASLNVYAGGQKLTVQDDQVFSFNPQDYQNKLFAINPMLQYDGRAMGFGIGGSFGIVGHDIIDDPSHRADYDPEHDARKSSIQARLRIFSERFSFVEILGGYDMGSVGDYNLQMLYGTRFNSDKYMMKAGFGFSRNGSRTIVLSGQMRLSPRLYLTPQMMIGYANNRYEAKTNGYRAAIGLEYRINDRQ